MPLPPAILLMGPTACGKTDLAVHLVQHLPCDIVSVDSAMVYRDMDIGTAKPDADTLARAPHRLIDFLDPSQAYSAASFRSDALREIDEIIAAGRIPLLTGGTMLYFQALRRGLANLPSADAQVRERIDAEAREIGWPGLHGKLAAVDPGSAARINANDPQRLQRALEVYELTGRAMSELLGVNDAPPLPCRFVEVVLMPADREKLHQRIARRFESMLAQGLVEEVEALRRRGDLHPGMASMRAVGYRQVWNYLAGDVTYTEMIEKSLAATRQLAKRQLTWLRKERDAMIIAAESCNKSEVVRRLAADSGLCKVL